MYKEHFLPEKKGMRVLLLDIENAPSLAYIWSLWTEPRNYKFVKDDWYIMSWAAKWLDEKEIIVKALPDYKKEYAQDRTNDKALLQELWKLLDEADVVAGHNAKKFDVRKINARFAAHGMPPPSPFKIVDTLLEARANFMFTANDLNSLGKILGLGQKVDNGGFELWKRCMAGCMKSWNLMKKYNKQDVALLEAVYLRLRPYM